MQQPLAQQSGNPSTLENNNPAAENIPQDEPSHSRSVKYIYALILLLITQKHRDRYMSKLFVQRHSCAIRILYSFLIFFAHINQIFSLET